MSLYLLQLVRYISGAITVPLFQLRLVASSVIKAELAIRNRLTMPQISNYCYPAT